jgi:hypothetical protein
METEYSPDAIIAARSLQTYTVRRFLVGLRVINNHLLLVHVWCVLPKPFFYTYTDAAQRPWLHSGCAYVGVFPSANELTCHLDI